MTRALSDVDLVYLYLDALALRVRSAGKVVSVPVLTAVGVLADGEKQLLALELCGAESAEAWAGFVDALTGRGLKAPLLCIIDGNAGLRRAVARAWPQAAVQRCCVHKLRNLERKAPKHALAELREDFHRLVYAASGESARAAYTACARKWSTRCPGVARSLAEGGDELLTFFRFPKAQWKTLRTTNAIERLNEEFRRRVKTQGSLPTEDAAVSLLFGLVASGQIRLGKFSAAHHKRVPRLLPRALELLTGYGWPGNVRQLENCIDERNDVVQGGDGPARGVGRDDPGPVDGFRRERGPVSVTVRLELVLQATEADAKQARGLGAVAAHAFERLQDIVLLERGQGQPRRQPRPPLAPPLLSPIAQGQHIHIDRIILTKDNGLLDRRRMLLS
jgi:hypothetical protein